MRAIFTGFGLVLVWLVYAFLTIYPEWIDTRILSILATSAGFLIVFLPRCRQRWTTKNILVTIAIFGVFLGSVRWVRNSAISRFKGAYASIHLGMTREQVEAIFDREFPAIKPSMRLAEDGGYIGLEPVDPSFNAEFIGVSLSNGRVTGKQYLPD